MFADEANLEKLYWKKAGKKKEIIISIFFRTCVRTAFYSRIKIKYCKCILKINTQNSYFFQNSLMSNVMKIQRMSRITMIQFTYTLHVS